MPKLYTTEIHEATAESQLPKDARHLIHVMCVYADHSTGVGWRGQEALAQLTGYSVRHVRALLAALGRPDSAPVRVERKARFRPDGRGRTSDCWQLVLVDQPAQHAGSSTTNRHPVPVEEARLTGTPRPTNRHATTDQPAQHAGDPYSDPCSEPDLRPFVANAPSRAGSGAPSKKPKKASKRKTKPKAEPQPPVPGAHELKLHYVAEFQRHRGAKAEFGKRWSRAMKAFGELVTTHGLDKSKAIVSRALGDAYARRIEPWALVDDAMRWLGAQPQSGNKHTVQRSIVDGWKPVTATPEWD